MRDVEQFIEKAHDIYGYEQFINDAGGSICELDDPQMLDVLAGHTVIIYLSADQAMEEKMIRRSIENPKPMYYQEAFLDEQLQAFMGETGLSSPAEIVPDEFVRWIFPRHVAHRRPKYEALADRYGYTVDARAAECVTGEAEFLELVAEAMG